MPLAPGLRILFRLIEESWFATMFTYPHPQAVGSLLYHKLTFAHVQILSWCVHHYRRHHHRHKVNMPLDNLSTPTPLISSYEFRQFKI